MTCCGCAKAPKVVLGAALVTILAELARPAVFCAQAQVALLLQLNISQPEAGRGGLRSAA